MEHKITIMKYQMMFPRMTKKLFDEKERIYQITVICIRLDELQTKGAGTTENGKTDKERYQNDVCTSAERWRV